MASEKITITSLDKATANEVYGLAKDAAERITHSVEKYTRSCLSGGTDCLKEGGNPDDRDPHLGAPVFVVRILAEETAIVAVLRALDPHFAAEWINRRHGAVNAAGRLWWSR